MAEKFKADGGVNEVGYKVVPHDEFPATSLADTLYQTGKQPTEKDKERTSAL